MATTSLARVALVEDDEDGSVPERGAPEKRPQKSSQPSVSGSDGAVVHVMAEVGNDETEVRQPTRREISVKCDKRNDPV
jgi:hypothetical protein